MSKIETLIGDLGEVLEKLSSVRDRLKQMKEEAGAVEKARDHLRGRRQPEKNQDYS